MYVAVVGRPIPIMRLAKAVMRRRRKKLPPARNSTTEDIIPPIPMLTMPTMIPAAAQASATAIMFIEPLTMPSLRIMKALLMPEAILLLTLRAVRIS